MKANKSLLMFSTAAILTLSFVGHSFAAATPFTDLASVEAKDKILTLQKWGYVQGVNDNQFLPDATVTAAQGIQLIVKALDLNIDNLKFFKKPQATDYFSRADNQAWYADSLIIAANNGLDLPSDLDPDKEWTKEEFINELILAMEKHGNLPMIKLVPVKINDSDELTIGYQGSIQRALVYKIVALDSEGRLHPKSKLTREEAAEIIFAAVEYLKQRPSVPGKH